MGVWRLGENKNLCILLMSWAFGNLDKMTIESSHVGWAVCKKNRPGYTWGLGLGRWDKSRETFLMRGWEFEPKERMRNSMRS